MARGRRRGRRGERGRGGKGRGGKGRGKNRGGVRHLCMMARGRGVWWGGREVRNIRKWNTTLCPSLVNA
jgi:hypothetical protein